MNQTEETLSGYFQFLFIIISLLFLFTSKQALLAVQLAGTTGRAWKTVTDWRAGCQAPSSQRSPCSPLRMLVFVDETTISPAWVTGQERGQEHAARLLSEGVLSACTISARKALFPLWRLSQCVGMCVSVCSALVPVEEMLLHVGMRILCKFPIRMRTCYLSFEKHQERKRIQYDKSIFLLLKGWVTKSNNVKRDIITEKICKCYFTPIVTKIF